MPTKFQNSLDDVLSLLGLSLLTLSCFTLSGPHLVEALALGGFSGCPLFALHGLMFKTHFLATAPLPKVLAVQLPISTENFE